VSAPKQSIVLVTPVWNDSARLKGFGLLLAQELARSGLPVRWIVADDGSTAEEKNILQDLVGQFSSEHTAVELMSFDERSRKGGAIYRTWDACPEADWLAFVDADGAIDAASTIHLLQHCCALGTDSGVVGIRHDTAQTPVRRPWMRALSFRLFRALVRALIGIHFEDTQCGAKVIPASAYRAVSQQLMERGFVFDVELLLAIQQHGCRLEELRLPWNEIPGGKVHPLRDAWGMIAGLWRISRRLRAGVYDRVERC
jgi:dolichyl-phosphate beta-glucosyltransferase